MSLGLETSEIFIDHETISKGSRFGVGSPLFVVTSSPRSSKPVSGDPRFFFGHLQAQYKNYEKLQPDNYDNSIFQLFREGNERGFAHYFHMHYQALHFFAIGIIKDPELAEDIVEETYLKLYEKRATIQSSDTIRSFLYTTVRNACIDKMRQQKNRAVHHHQLSYLLDDPEKTIDDHLIRTETYAQVLAAIEELPTAVRKVVKLYYIEGKDSNEIAAELNRSKETVRKQKHHGLVFLRKRLSGLQIFLLIFFSHTHNF